MLQLYYYNDKKLDIANPSTPIEKISWVDLISPTPAERSYVTKYFKQPLLSISELEDIESSARFYEDEHGIHILSFFLCDMKSDKVKITTIGFIIKGGVLFTLREKEVSTFRVYISRSKRIGIFTEEKDSCYTQLLNLLGTKTEHLADEIEFIYSELDSLNQILIATTETEFDVILLKLASLEDSSSKIRLCLMDSQRALVYLSQKIRNCNIDRKFLDLTNDMLKNVESLIPHNEALFQRINFITQTAMGLIEINQNSIMKVISVFTILGMPVTILTSWFGMDIKSFFGPEYLECKFQFMSIMIVCLATGILYYVAKKVKWI